MAIFKKELYACKCERCGHEWVPRAQKENEILETVKVCPSCKNPYWNVKVQKKERS